MKKQFHDAVTAKPEEDDLFDLSSMVTERPQSLSMENHTGIAASSALVCTGQGKGQGTSSSAKKGSRASNGNADFVCGCAIIDKAISGKVLDPIAAACKARKATLREFNNTVIRIDKAKEACLTVLGKKHEEVHLPQICVQD